MLKWHITLPVEICERLLHTRAAKTPKLINHFVQIFTDRQATRLKRVRLRGTNITDEGLCILLAHQLTELDLADNLLVSKDAIAHISSEASSLLSLTIGEQMNLFPASAFGDNIEKEYQDRNYIIYAPNLRRLSLRKLAKLKPVFFQLLLSPMRKLQHLDLSACGALGNFKCMAHLSNLTSLVLYNVAKIEKGVLVICTLKNLQHLDISQSKDENGKYANGTGILTLLIHSLPKLRSLDISGTNLAGTGVAESPQCVDCIGSPSAGTDIPGLAMRVHNPLQFIGLYETKHDACLRHDIPAQLIAGNANEEQIFIAALAYLDRAEMLQKVLNELFHLFRYETCKHVGQALYIVLEAMNRHPNERHIQISGSATLFYIVKGTGKELHEVMQVKRRIITTLLDAMCVYRYDDTMMRNGCLTLCQFKIPDDVVFDFERLVIILLHSVQGMAQESFVQRIGIYLLNSLACQVDAIQKIKLGELGVINKMLGLIDDRLDRGLCDDVLEATWSTMWNVTDETPANCSKFLEGAGMEYFLKCLGKFPDKEELLRNMMGLLGNVAEVRALRHHLMNPKYIAVFAALLDSLSDGIEVSYNAAGVISHIAADGPEAWTVEQPSREEVLWKMVTAIDKWDLRSDRNINYRSFEPILHLARTFETPECQQWAVWALANLTGVYPEKYCDVVMSEGGMHLLDEIIDHPLPPRRVKELAHIVIENCRTFKERCCMLDG